MTKRRNTEIRDKAIEKMWLEIPDVYRISNRFMFRGRPMKPDYIRSILKRRGFTKTNDA